ncbi:hypothetical protein FQN60_009684 [Etheostoma spectabile]|uniref:receptor protein-tyrosine kinase n=1 Tax=Etheostoma spectabile TaxID=54343 RepID=A0A5J5DJY0_9PERO|nr:hypothetical protein FQN60_009684 [Etheostoma spectabile]
MEAGSKMGLDKATELGGRGERERRQPEEEEEGECTLREVRPRFRDPPSTRTPDFKQETQSLKHMPTTLELPKKGRYTSSGTLCTAEEEELSPFHRDLSRPQGCPNHIPPLPLSQCQQEVTRLSRSRCVSNEDHLHGGSLARASSICSSMSVTGLVDTLLPRSSEKGEKTSGVAALKRQFMSQTANQQEMTTVTFAFIRLGVSDNQEHGQQPIGKALTLSQVTGEREAPGAQRTCQESHSQSLVPFRPPDAVLARPSPHPWDSFELSGNQGDLCILLFTHSCAQTLDHWTNTGLISEGNSLDLPSGTHREGGRDEVRNGNEGMGTEGKKKVAVRTETLMDSTTATAELGWTVYPVSGSSDNSWEEVSGYDENMNTIRTYQVCNVFDNNQNNWVRTKYIRRRGAQRIHVEMKFSVRDCSSIPNVPGSCKETFNLYYYESDADTATRTSPAWMENPWIKVDTIAADESFSQVDLGGRVMKINTEVRSFGPVSRNGFYLAFQDYGGCMSLIAVRVFYRKCPRIITNGALFQETLSGAESTSLVAARGVCIPNAEEVDVPIKLYCNGDGEWMVPIGRCMCKAGNEAVENGTVCRARSLQSGAMLLQPSTTTSSMCACNYHTSPPCAGRGNVMGADSQTLSGPRSMTTKEHRHQLLLKDYRPVTTTCEFLTSSEYVLVRHRLATPGPPLPPLPARASLL